MKRKTGSMFRKTLVYILALSMILQCLPLSFASAAVEANVEFTTAIYAGASENTAVDSIQSGQSFMLKATYAFYPHEGGGAYKYPVISVEVPAGAVVDSIVDISGDVDSSSQYTNPTTNKTYVLFNMKADVNPGSQRTVGIRCHFENMTTADGTQATFVASLNGQFVPDPSNPDEYEAFNTKNATSTITATAGDEWDVTKTVDSQGSAEYEDSDEYYYVTYRIKADLKDGANTDRYGRLELDEYSLTDVLPTLNVQSGGEPIFVSASAVDMTLDQGKDYTVVEENGKLKSITFTKYNTRSLAGSYVPAGSSIATEYLVTVKYLKSAYETLANQGAPEIFDLTNTSTLTYSLMTVDESVTKTDTATVSLGWFEQNPQPKDLTVRKQLKIGDQTFDLDSDAIAAGYEQAKFGLYSNAAGTSVAYDINQQAVAEQITDAEGRVIFSNLRAGTYYLKETYIPNGFISPISSTIPVTIAEDGTLSYDGLTSQSEVVVVNQADNKTYGLVELFKKGVPAGSGSQINLEGVGFRLYKKLDDGTYEVTPTKEGSTDAAGHLLFQAVPVGAYLLKEISLTSDQIAEGYAINPDGIEIEVLGNQLVRPAGNGIIVNTSQKGKFSLEKVDQANSSLRLGGAKFALYGPMTTQPTDGDTPIENIVVPDSGLYTSNALTPGTYWLKETKAPDGYRLDGSWIQVQVSANHTEGVSAPNEKLSTLTIYKWGSWAGIAEYTGLENVDFKIYDSASDGNLLYTITSTVDATGRPSKAPGKSSITIPAGTYYIEEDTATTPEGYTPDDSASGGNRKKIVIGAGEDAEATFYNQTTMGAIEILKCSSRDEAVLLENVVFDVYSDAGLNNLVDTITTDASGKAKTKLLPATGAVYYLKERADSVPEGYTIAIEVISGTTGSPDANGFVLAAEGGSGIAVPSNGVTKLKIYNDKLVSAKLKKTDVVNAAGGAGDPMAIGGVTFALFDVDPQVNPDAKSIQTPTTDSKGELVFENLEPSKQYWYQETSVPAGYILSDNVRTFLAPANSDDEQKDLGSVANLKRATVEVLKQGALDDNTAPLAGAEFVLYPYNSGDAQADYTAAQMDGTLHTMAATGADGKTSANDIQPGRYWLKEIVAPEGFAVAAPQEITVLSGDNTAGHRSFVNTVNDSANKGKLRIRKIDSVSGEGISGATFGIYLKTGDTYATDPVQILTSQNGGYVVSGWLAPGTYGVKEISVPGNYVMDSRYHDIVVSEGVTTGLENASTPTIENDPMGQMKIIKTATWTIGGALDNTYRIPLAGVVFEAFPKTIGGNKDSDQAQAEIDGTIFELTTGSDGTVTSSPVVPGDYWVVEKTPVSGYSIVGDGYLSVTIPPGNIGEAEFDNRPEKGRILIQKLDFINRALHLNGAVFEVYREDVDGAVSGPGGIKLTKVGGNITTGTTGGYGRGFALTNELEPGIYYLKEIAAPSGYQMIEEWTGPISVTAANISEKTVLNYKPVDAEGVKTDDAGNLVSGAYIGLFASLTDAQAFNAFLDSNIVTKSDLTNAEFLSSHKIVDVSISNARGEFAFEDLQPGSTVFILELLSPQNYLRNAEIFERIIGDDGGFSDAVVIENWRYGRIQIKKTTEIGGVTQPLAGAVFRIYEAVPKASAGGGTDNGGHITGDSCDYEKNQPDSFIETGTTDDNGLITTNLLPPGHYIVEEYSAPVGFTKNTDTYHIVVSPNGTNTYLASHPVNNVAEYGQFTLDKVSSQNASTRVSATFKVEKWDDALDTWMEYIHGTDDAQMTFTTQVSGSYVSPYMPPGKYRITETAVLTNGYTFKAKTAEFEISAANMTTTNLNGDPLTLTNEPKGSILLDKYSQFDGGALTAMKSVTFALYPWSGDGNAQTDCTTENELMRAVTTSSGRAQFAGVDAGTYWVKEIGIGADNAGYAASLPARKVVVTPGETNSTLTGTTNGFVNQSIYGKLQISKVDKNDASVKLGGAVFNIYIVDDVAGSVIQGGPDVNLRKLSETITTAENTGIGITGLIEPGVYYLKEVTAPSGYHIEGNGFSGPYTVQANQTTVAETAITNVKYQSVEITKVNRETGAAISGVGFALYDENPETNPQAVSIRTGATNSSGKLVFSGLEPNTDYWIKETTVPVGYVANTEAVYSIRTTNSGTTPLQVENIPQGKITIKKVFDWIDTDGMTVVLDLAGAVFKVYKYDDATGRGSEVAEITTNGYGVATTDWLDPGKYELVESRIPEHFAIDPNQGAMIVTVQSGQTESTFTGASAIKNVPDKGRFQVRKLSSGTPGTPLNGAEFELYKQNTGGDYQLVSGENATFSITQNGSYLSGYIEPGNYRIIEKTAPLGYTLDKTPHDFTVTQGATVEIEVLNDAQANLVVTKKSDAQNGSKNLSGAQFQLYLGPIENGVKIGTPKTTDSQGTVTWAGLDAGVYYIEELSAPDGYAVNQSIAPVTITAQGTVKTYFSTVENTANKGKILISKVDSSGKGLAGAVFEIYEILEGDRLGNLVDTVTTLAGGTGVSKLLPATLDGSKYLVREVKAPDGYYLDDRLTELEKTVVVKPLHSPQDGGVTNFVSFVNLRDSDLVTFHNSITKRIISSTANPQSLLQAPFHVTYRLDTYTDGKNQLPLENFTVSDNDFKFFYNASADDASPQYEQIETADGDYDITKVRVYRAYNDNAQGGAIRATVEYQTFAQLGTDRWTQLPAGYELTDLQNLAAGEYRTVTLAGISQNDIMGIRVVYTGTGKNFIAEGVELDVTFNQRPSDETAHEVRKITNTSRLDYQYTEYDSQHASSPVEVGTRSNVVESLLPKQEIIQTAVSLTNRATDPDKTYVVGNPIRFQLTAKNESTEYSIFKDPILSFDVPAYTTLDRSFNSGGSFIIRDNTGAILKPTSINYEQVNATYYNPQTHKIEPLLDANGNHVKTTRVTFLFADHEMAPGEEINITYETIVNSDKPSSVTEVFSPAYLGSAYRLPKSVENPQGISFINTLQNGKPIGNSSLDQTVDNMVETIPDVGEQGENAYLNDNASVYVANDNAISIVKQVRGPKDSAYLNAGEKAYSYPEDYVDYRLTVRNEEGTDMKTLRVIDILPFKGDSYVIRSETGAVTGRSTELPTRPVLESVKAQVPAGGSAIVYYTTMSFANRAATGREDELPMMYDRAGAWSGWTTSEPSTPEEWANVTAIGIEITFPDSDLFGSGDSYSAELRVTMPGFTADEIDQYYDKLAANSAAAAALPSATTEPIVRVENNEVLSYMHLPTGSIGDYVFQDVNANGIQDTGDLAIANLEVKLYRTDYLADGTQQSYTYTDTTDALGKYLFTDLPCNMLRQGATEGSTNPTDYVGDVYTVYRVVFGDPGSGFVPTLQNEGTDDAIDSDINALRVVENVTLRVMDNTDPTQPDLIGEENLTIDAGFVLPAALGDRVWLDVNRNGYQDPGEEGVNGVTVNLYRVTDGAVGSTPMATEMTADNQSGEAGYYLFTNLVPGEYVVEFDISALMKADGYTYQYAFTAPNTAADLTGEYDSDASVRMDEDGRIMRTQAIVLPEETVDLNWDAGLIVYSALGGYCFDDRDYDDLQSIGIALPGTEVTLYRVVNGIRETTPFRPMQTVGEDGTYYFDQLIEGTYAVHFDFPDDYQAVNANVGSDITLDSDASTDLSGDLNSGYTAVITLPYDTVDTTWDAGARLYGAIGDYVWYDNNFDGLQGDADNEPPAAGVKVTLERKKGIDSLWSFYGETTTDENGYYLFDGLESGLDAGYYYRVVFGEVDGFSYTLNSVGLNDQIDSDALPVYIDALGYPTDTIFIAYGALDDTWDAGLTTASSALGDYVWLDSNKNGLQDSEERGIAGIEVVLEYNSTGDLANEAAWIQIRTMETDTNGKYLFENLKEGWYRVKFNLPSQYTVTRLESGTDENSYEYDSDAIYPGNGTWYSTRSIYLNFNTIDLTWDAGVYTGGGVRTGDTDQPVLLIVLLSLSGLLICAAIVYLIMRRKGRIRFRHER